VNGRRDLDAVGLLRTLTEASVEFILIGGTAAQMLGLPVPQTIDVDIVPLRSAQNLEKLAEFFEIVEASLLTAEQDGTWFPKRPFSNWSQYDTLHLLTNFGLLDLVFSPTGVLNGYEGLQEDSSIVDFNGVRVRMISEEQWVHLKRSTGREKDLDHLRRYFSSRRR
jgi:predicted nucleotidyltransferase